MAQNRFAKYAQPRATAPQPQAGGNRFARFAKPQEQAQPEQPYTANNDAENQKGDMQSLPASVQARDAAKSFGSGVIQGTAALLGTVGDMQDLAGEGASFIAGKFGASPDTQQTVRNIVSKAPNPLTYGLRAPRGQEVQAQVERVTGPMYEPQTTAGRYARSVGQFAPNVVAGPGGVIRKGAMTVIPAVASEFAGDLTEGTAAQPYAKAGTAVVTALATGGKPNIAKLAAKNAPARATIQAETDALFEQLRNAGIKYDSNEFSRMATALERRLSHMGVHPKLSPNSSAILDDIKAMVANGASPDFNDYQRLRMLAGDVASSGNPMDKLSLRDAKFAGEIKKALDGFADSASYVHNGTASNAKELFTKANALAARNIKARTFETAIEKARDQSSGFENGLRIQFRRLKNDTQFFKSLTPVEQRMVKEIVRGTTPQNLLAQFGRTGIAVDKLGSKATLIPALITGTAYSGGEVISGLGVVAAGTAAKFAAGKNAEKIARRAIDATVAGPIAQREAAAKASQARLAKARTVGMSAQESTAVPANWPQGAFMQDANGRFYDRNGKPLPTR